MARHPSPESVSTCFLVGCSVGFGLLDGFSARFPGVAFSVGFSVVFTPSAFQPHSHDNVRNCHSSVQHINLSAGALMHTCEAHAWPHILWHDARIYTEKEGAVFAVHADSSGLVNTKGFVCAGLAALGHLRQRTRHSAQVLREHGVHSAPPFVAF
jgi:hypothetical protein